MTDIFEYLDKNIKKNEESLFKEKKSVYNLDKIFTIVEDFIISNKLICYGGTALNNILPNDKQFYNYDVTYPDYDFFSKTAYDHILELANIFKKKGYKNIRAKSAIHDGTYKLYVNYIPVADITQMDGRLFDKLSTEVIVKNGLSYAPIHFLRMNLFLELSRPRGDLSRWEKVLKRMIIFNETYPFTMLDCKQTLNSSLETNKESRVHRQLRTLFQAHSDSLVFIGDFAMKEYAKYFTGAFEGIFQKIKMPTFVVLHENPKEFVGKIEKEVHDITVRSSVSIDDVIPKIYEIYKDNECYGMVVKAMGCQNYNTITRRGISYNIGTIDTILYYYFMFFYISHTPGNRFLDNVHCYAYLLFHMQNNVIIENKNLLQRFNLSCIGKQVTFEDIIDKKKKKYERLKNNKKSIEYKHSFLDYVPRKRKRQTKRKNKTNNKNNVNLDKDTSRTLTRKTSLHTGKTVKTLKEKKKNNSVETKNDI